MTKKAEKIVIDTAQVFRILFIPILSLFGAGVGLAIKNLALGTISGVVVGGILFGILRARTMYK